MNPYYEHAGITIYNCDCREVLPALGKSDLLLTDPPYGVGRAGGFDSVRGFSGRGKSVLIRTYEDDWDNERPDCFDLLLASASKAVIWGGNYFADLLPQSTHWLVWDKLVTMPSFSDYELAWTSIKNLKSTKKLTVEWNGLLGKEAVRDHPTQKPVELMKLCVLRYSEPGETVLDPYMGSGTTLVAAKTLGRKAIGVEIEEKYCEIAALRLRQEVFDFGQAEPQRKLPGQAALPVTEELELQYA